MNDDRIPLRDALVRAVVPLAALAAMAALGTYEVDPVGRAETAYLAVLATAVLLAVSFLAPPPAWETGLGATLATAVVWALPTGPGRGAAMVMLLVAGLAVAAWRRYGEAAFSLAFLLPLAFGLQVLLRGGELLFQPQINLRLLVILLVLPAAGALATAVLMQRHGSAALIAAGAVLLLEPGWNVAATSGLMALAAGDLIDRRWGGLLATAAVTGAFLLMPGPADLSMAAGPLALAVLYLGRKTLAFPAVVTASLLFATTLLASYPWLRNEPLRDALGLFVRIPSPGAPLLPAATSAVVDAAHPSWGARITGEPMRTVVIESSLSNGTGLVNGTPVATVRLRGPDGLVSEHVLRAGIETGEWAARRADVAAASILKSPPAWISWVAGDFLGQRYRALWTVEAPGFSALSVERNPDLPPQVSLALHGVEVRP